MLSHATYAIVRMTLQNVVSLLCKPKGVYSMKLSDGQGDGSYAFEGK